MIEINNVTEDQKAMLDYMWSINSTKELIEWIEELDECEQMQAMSLVTMLGLAMIDEMVEEMGTFPEVERMLNKLIDNSSNQ